jgi:excisionase family DNA binding protein
MENTTKRDRLHCRRGGLSPREAADDLGVCVATIYVLLGTGELASYKIGRARRIPRESIDAIKQQGQD